MQLYKKRNTPEKLKAFISYSREDMEFVDRLQESLLERDVAASVDRSDIAKGEEWWGRIQQLILQADTIIFVLSPSSVNSLVCQQEVDFAESLNKRFVPIVARDLEGVQVPLALARLNYIFFIEDTNAGASGNYESSVEELVSALETDIAWIREHTRLAGLAQRWQARNQARELLLRGAELTAAETWRSTRPKYAPAPTDAHRAFITAGRVAASQRQRITMGLSLTAAAVAIGLASFAYWQRNVAVDNERQSRKERDAALTTQSRFLVDLAERHVWNGDPITATLLAMEGLPDKTATDKIKRERPYILELERQMYRSLMLKREYAVLENDGAITSATFSPDSHFIATTSLDVVNIWDVFTGKLLRTLRGHQLSINAVEYSRDGTRLLTAGSDRTARVWDAKTGKQTAILDGHFGQVTSATFSPDGSFIGKRLTNRIFCALI